VEEIAEPVPALHLEVLAVFTAAVAVAAAGAKTYRLAFNPLNLEPLALLALSASSTPVRRAPSHQHAQGTYKWQLFQAFFLR